MNAASRSLVATAEIGVSYARAKALALERFERDFLSDLMQRAAGNLSQAARDARMTRPQLRSRLRRYGLWAR